MNRALTIDEVISLFEKMPGHYGCSESVLDEAELHVGGGLPPTYRRLMLRDSQRLLNRGLFLSPGKLVESTHDAQELLEEDGYAFRLKPSHAVFAWAGGFAFYYFEAVGSDDVPVFEFNFYSNATGLPGQASNSIPQFFRGRFGAI